ncbi:hypothetical protein Leryth_024762 [Lithospermum erythrorhizon]|nr:hypothetical protein Leryth_024762 [Lithospermum erythrorhizon]
MLLPSLLIGRVKNTFNANVVFDELPESEKQYHSIDVHNLNDCFNYISGNLSTTEALNDYLLIKELENNDICGEGVHEFGASEVFDKVSYWGKNDSPMDEQVIYDNDVELALDDDQQP